jgi:hypothetical protein
MATAKKTTAAPESAESSSGDLGLDEVQAKFDEANAKGYFGETPDETPNENYTLAGVTSGEPTPETQRGKK